MKPQDILYKVHIDDIDFKNIPNDEEYYFTIDLVGNKKVHKCKYIKSKDANSGIRYVLLNKDQLKDNITEQRIDNKDLIEELVEDCKLVEIGTESNGHDCWGNYEYTTYKFVYVNNVIKRVWDGWRIIHDGKKVINVLIP